ncbi:MAG: glycosyltransferase [Thermoguttaceae bacterium]
MPGEGIAVLATSAVAAWCTAKALARARWPTAWIDFPNARSLHVTPTPRVGGLALLVGVAAGIFMVGQLGIGVPGVAILCGVALMALLGLADDAIGVSIPVRIAVQLLAAAIVVYATGGLVRLPLPSPLDVPLGVFAVPLSLLWLVGVTNVYNFLDGIDGFAAAQGLIVGTAAACFAADGPMLAAGLAIAGACLGFLPQNWHPAKMFMGDGGALMLGFAVATLPCLAAPDERGQAAFCVAMCLWFFLSDGAFTICRRLRHGETIWRAHCTHLYQRLVKSGLKHHQVTGAVMTAATLLAVLAVAACRSGEPRLQWWLAALAVASFLAYWALTCRRELRIAAQPARTPHAAATPPTASLTQSALNHSPSFVTIIVPCRNEKEWIGPCLSSIVGNDYPKDRIEVLVVDGMSDDGTRSAMRPLLEQCDRVRCIDNPKRSTPAAMNIGIAAARGEIIMRMDAHYEYPMDYVSRLVGWLERSRADNVGGVLRIDPANGSAMARAIAVAVVHPFGVGGARHRLGVSQPCAVDTVPFGCYRREVFERIGPFDEDLLRNQDMDFNLRLRKEKGEILLVPDVVIRGRARDSLAKIARLYYQTGYFNSLVIWKRRRAMSVRHTVPPMFMLGLLLTGALGPWCPCMAIAFVGMVSLYAIAAIAVSAESLRRHGLNCALRLLLVFPLIHFSRGAGVLAGLCHFIFAGRRRGRPIDIPLSR